MFRLIRLLLAAVLTATLALIGLGSGAGPASATALPLSQCTTTSGVILAVDFSHWGGPLLRSCGSVPTTGYTLLNQGGWQTQGTNHDGPAFICRIGYSGFQDGTKYPTSATEACNLTPPASAYWSYWHANPGQNTWSYSQLGAQSYKPANGSVDLWIFGATDVAGTRGTPQITPDSVRAHNTSSSGGSGGGGVAAPSTHSSSAPTASKPVTTVPPVTASPNSTGAGSDSGMHRGPATGSSVAATPSRTPVTASACATARATPRSSSSTATAPAPTASRCPATSAATAGPSPTSPGGTAGSPSGGTKIVDAEPVAGIKHSSGSFVPELVAGVLVLALGGAAGVTGWRRRQAR